MSTLEDVSATKDVSHVDDEMVDGVSSLHLPLDVDNLTHLIRSTNLDVGSDSHHLLSGHSTVNMP